MDVKEKGQLHVDIHFHIFRHSEGKLHKFCLFLTHTTLLFLAKTYI